MWEFGEDSMKMRISRLACECQPAKQATWKAHDGIWRVFDRLDFASHSWLRPSCEWPAKLSAWLFWVCLFSYPYKHYINPHYPQNCKKNKESLQETFERGTLAKHLRVRNCLPTILYIISLKFPLLLPLHLHILERFLAQTLTLSILSVERSFGAYGKHWKKPLSGRCNREELWDLDN